MTASDSLTLALSRTDAIETVVALDVILQKMTAYRVGLFSMEVDASIKRLEWLRDVLRKDLRPEGSDA